MQPQMHLLTNGEWSVAVSDCGTSVSLYRESDITWRGGDLLRRPKGIFAVARAQEETLPLCRALDYRSGAEFERTVFTHAGAPHGMEQNARGGNAYSGASAPAL